MPKWGMTMTEGTLVTWLVEEGDEIAVGDEVAEVETEKILGPVEAQFGGKLRRRVAKEGDIIPIRGLLAVIANSDVDDAEVDAFVERATADIAVAPEDGTVEGPRMLTVDSSLGWLHALAGGEAPESVVLLHGFGGDALNWSLAIEGLSVERTAVAVDLPGHGASTKDVGAGSVDELVTSVVDLMDAEGIPRAHLVGHSLGGLVAASLALSQPERVTSLALVAPAGFGEEIDGEFIDAIVAASSRRELKVALRKLFADESLLTRQLVEEVLRYKRLEGVPEALGTLRDSLFPEGRQRVEVASRLAALELPLLVVWGAEDEIIPAAQASAAPAAARVEIVEGVGHSPHVEASTAVNALLREHLEAAVPASDP